MNTFSPTEAIKYGWKTFKTNPGFLIGLLVIVYGVQFALSFVVGLIPDNNSSGWVLAVITSLITTIFSIIISLGMINALLKFVNTGKGNFADIFSEFSNFKLLGNYIIGSILVALIIIGGFILLIIPGIYFAIRLSYFSYFIVEKKLGAKEAIKASWDATKGNVINLIVFGFLSFGVMILGLLALLVGLLVAIPVVSLAGVYVYKMLSRQASPGANIPTAVAPAVTVPTPTPIPPAPTG